MDLPLVCSALRKAGKTERVWPRVFTLRGSLIFTVSFLPLFLLSCGYTLVGKGRTLPDTIRTVSIPIFKNVTAEPGIEVTVSNVLINEFMKDGRLGVDKTQDADLVIQGSVSGYQIRPVAFDSSDKVETYRLELGISVEVKESKSGDQLLQQSFQGEWDFNSTSDISATEPRREVAIKNAARDAARKMISILIEGF